MVIYPNPYMVIYPKFTSTSRYPNRYYLVIYSPTLYGHLLKIDINF